MTYDREIKIVENNRQGCLIYKWMPNRSLGFDSEIYYSKNAYIFVGEGTLAVAYLNNGKKMTDYYHFGKCYEPLFPDDFIKSLPISIRFRGQIDEGKVEIYFMRYSFISMLYYFI